MPKYTQESVERVKDAIDIVDLIGAKTELRRSGQARLEGLCPFHDERTPSFGIDPVQKLYHCFGCNAGGDGITFVRETEGVDFVGAIELLADRYGVELEVEDEDPQEAARRQRRARLYELLERTATFYVRTLWESKEAEPAREYLLGRGLDEQSLRTFRVGYAPSAWDTVLMASRRAGFSNRELYDAGLVKRARGEGQIFDMFRRRITFPLTDPRGRVIGFGARAMSDDQKPKYVNTAESELFSKRRQVYAADLARATAAKAGSVIVVEGYTDVVMLHQAGIENVVAIMGTSLTDEQVKALVRLAPVAHLALDADNAGQEAMLRAAKVAGNEKLELRVVPMPEGMDPAEIVGVKGAEEMRSLVERSMPFLRFEIRRIVSSADTSTADRKDLVLDVLRPYFSQMRRGTMRDELTQWVENELDLPQNGVERYLSRPAERSPAELSRAMSGGRDREPRRPPVQQPRHDDRPPIDESMYVDPEADHGGSYGPTSGPDPASAVTQTEEVERRFLAFCLALPDQGADALASVDLEQHFTSPLARRAAAHLRTHLREPRENLPEHDPELDALITEVVVRSQREPVSPAILDAQRLQLELRRIDREMRRARAEGSGGVSDLARTREAIRAEFNDAMERASAN